MSIASPSQASLTGSTFEGNDGNQVVNGANQSDWESFLPEPDTDNTFVFTDTASGATDDSLAGGTKDNTECPTPSTGSIPNNKDDLLRFYLSHETKTVNGTPHTFLYLGYVRALPGTTTASAHGVFELNQTNTKCPNVGAKGNNPGTPSPFYIRVPGDVRLAFDDEGGNTPVVSYQIWGTTGCANNADECWGTKTALLASQAEGAFNAVAISDRIMGTPAATLDLSPQQFAEVSVDMTAANLLNPNSCIGFGAAGLYTGSSGNSDQEQSKDFIAPQPINLQNCAPATVNVVKTFTLAPTSDAVFTLYYNNNDGGTPKDISLSTCTVTPASVVLVSNVLTGTCSFAALNFGTSPFTTLGPHRLVVSETTVPTGFNGSADQNIGPFSFGPNALTFTVNFSNSPAPHDVDLKKVDDAGNPLSGVVFTLYNDSDGDGAFDDANSQSPGPDTSTNRTCTTDAQGICHENNVSTNHAFGALSPGKYCVVETTGKPGHDLAAPVCFTVSLTSPATINLTDIVDPRQHRIIVLVCHEGTLTLYPSEVTLTGHSDSPEDSLGPAGLTTDQQAALCNTGGANFGNISGHGEHTLTVDLGDPGH